MQPIELTVSDGVYCPSINDDTSIAVRAKFVKERLLTLKADIEGHFLDICDLLEETEAGDYHIAWNYSSFESWVEQGSGLDLKARQAYYYLNVSRKCKTLDLDRDKLLKIGISKLKEIFTLDPVKHTQDIHTLIDLAAEGASLSIVRTRVRELTAPGVVPPSFVTLKLEAEVKETFDEAIELARRNYGSTINQHGNVADISISKALELILVNYLQDPNNHPEQ